jgi:Flp pilus assembly protein TadD, contains TPR repeats
MEWTKNQHRRRVLERNASRVSSMANPLEDVINNALYASDPVSRVVASENKKESNVAEKFGSEKDVDDYVEPLINRRKALLRSKNMSFDETSKNQGTVNVNVDEESEVDEEDDSILELNLLPTKDYLTDLKKTFDKNVSKVPNNYQVKQLYQKAKAADQAGDTKSAKRFLLQLQTVTPQDTRVIRRLARLESQEGNMDKAREILQSALRSMPKSGDVLQGLAQQELSCGNTQKARQYFREAILSAPKFPNPYHALATLEHSEGNIRVATAILRLGLKHCPTNHRLHHALGDLYREANMLDMAEKAYQKGLRCVEFEAEKSGKNLDWGKSFLYTALSYVYYDKGDIAECRKWLRKSIDSGNNCMHSQGW